MPGRIPEQGRDLSTAWVAWGAVLVVCYGCRSKVPQLKYPWLKQGKWMVSQFWRLEPEVSVSRVWLLPRVGRESLFQASFLAFSHSGVPWFADGVLHVCSRCLSSLRVCLCV